MGGRIRHIQHLAWVRGHAGFKATLTDESSDEEKAAAEEAEKTATELQATADEAKAKAEGGKTE
jgi:hypothetical protein